MNIPEFVNIPYDGMRKIDTPPVESYRPFDRAFELMKAGRYETAAAEWRNVLALAAEQGRRPRAEALKTRISLYEAGRPDRRSR